MQFSDTSGQKPQGLCAPSPCATGEGPGVQHMVRASKTVPLAHTGLIPASSSREAMALQGQAAPSGFLLPMTHAHVQAQKAEGPVVLSAQAGNDSSTFPRVSISVILSMIMCVSVCLSACVCVSIFLCVLHSSSPQHYTCKAECAAPEHLPALLISPLCSRPQTCPPLFACWL